VSAGVLLFGTPAKRPSIGGPLAAANIACLGEPRLPSKGQNLRGANRSKGIAKSRSECPHHRTFPNTVYFSVKFPVKGSNSGRCGWDCQRTGFFLPNQTSHYGTESPEEPTGRTSACRFRPGKSDAVWGVRYPQWTTQRFDLHLWQWPLISE
jgi:hypothetical protein